MQGSFEGMQVSFDRMRVLLIDCRYRVDADVFVFVVYIRVMHYQYVQVQVEY